MAEKSAASWTRIPMTATFDADIRRVDEAYSMAV